MSDLTIELARRALAATVHHPVDVTAFTDGVADTPAGAWRVEWAEAELQPDEATIVAVRPDVRVHPSAPPFGVVLADEDWTLDPAGVQRAWRELGAERGLGWGALLALRFDEGILPVQVIRSAGDPMVGRFVRPGDPVPPEGDATTRRLLAWRAGQSSGAMELVTYVVTADAGELHVEVEAIRDVD